MSKNTFWYYKTSPPPIKVKEIYFNKVTVRILVRFFPIKQPKNTLLR